MGRPTYATTPGFLRTSDRNGPKVTDPQACYVNSSCVSAKNSKHSLTGFTFYEVKHRRSGNFYSGTY